MSVWKRYSFFSVYILAFLPVLGCILGGFYNYLPLAIVFGFIPSVDYFFKDPNNPTSESIPSLLGDHFFKWVTILYVPLQLMITAICLYWVSQSDLRWYEWLGFALSLGVVTGGLGITVAHELMHKNSKLQHGLSKLLLINVCYGHFFIEHIRGHHVHVATPRDPATARFGESFYQFYPRTVIGSFKSAWKIEVNRLLRKNRSLWSFSNQFWWIIWAPVGVMGIIYTLLGLSATLFFVVQAVIGFSLLEVVNYVEHYGLLRDKKEDGSYERVSPKHSWNSNHRLTNSLLFHLQRHSDHHTYPGRPYQVLRHLEESPQLPSGYAGMICIALIPPLWFKIMNKRCPKQS